VLHLSAYLVAFVLQFAVLLLSSRWHFAEL